MLSVLVVCVVMAGAMASKPGMPFEAVPDTRQPPHEHHEPCCFPRYFTFKQVQTAITVSEGRLLVKDQHVAGAYDSISERIAYTLDVDVFNGTDHYFKFIGDYRQRVKYRIAREGQEVVCHVSEIEEKFDDYCIPKNATFLGETTLGDHDLLADSWYYVQRDGRKHTISTVQHEGCVPISLFIRKFDTEKGQETEVDFDRVFDFNLGICDPEKFFKIPEECQPGRALAELTPKMLKTLSSFGLFH